MRALNSCRHAIVVTCASCVISVNALAQDTIRIRADNAPAWGENVQLVLDLAIGALDGPPEYTFGSIEAVAVHPSGAFYLYDSKDRQIRRYDAKGKFLGLVGKKGSGPGEYAQVAAMGFLGDSLLVVFDPNNARLALFEVDGKPHGTSTTARRTFYGGNYSLVDTAGLIYLIVSVPGAASEGGSPLAQYLRVRPDGKIVDSLYVQPDNPKSGGFAIGTSDGMRFAFPELTVTTASPVGGLIFGRTDAYRFGVRASDGTVLLVERAHRPVSLGSAERAEWEAWSSYLVARGVYRRPIPIPSVKPPFRSLTGDGLGRVWVNVYVAAEKRNIPPRPAGDGQPLLTWREVNAYDVFSPTGTYLGRVALPPESQLLAISGDRLWLKTKGVSDEQRIAVYRIERRRE